MLARTGIGSATGGGEAAASLLSAHIRSDSTWRNRSSQIRKWLTFCDEDNRSALPAAEGDVLAYIGFLTVDGRVSAASAPQYIAAVSTYHKDHRYPSPTRTRLVRELLQAFVRSADVRGPDVLMRTGCSAELVKAILHHGLRSSVVQEVGSCSVVVFSFIFQLRSVSVRTLAPSEIEVSSESIRVTIHRRKGKLRRRPLLLTYPANQKWGDSATPHALLLRWLSLRSPGDTFFNGTSGASLDEVGLRRAVSGAVASVGVKAPPGYYFASHSPRIGGLNELVNLHFPKPWIMHRLDWESEAMFQVYYDGQIRLTAASSWFFAHLRP